MESFPAEVWTLILRSVGELEIKELLKSTKLVRSKIFQGLREYHSSSLSWPLSFIEKMPSLVSFTSHGPIQDWSRLSLLPKKLHSFCGGYISGQDAPDFRGSQLRELSVSTAFISWNIVNSLPKALTKLVIQECRYFGDELFAVLPRSLVSLKILNRERNCACGVKGGEYESSSFITDMAFLDLPASLTDLEVHSSRAFSDLALKLLKPTLVHLRLTPTVFTPTGTFHMPPELETIDFSNQSGPVEIPPETKMAHISSVKLGTVVLDSLARLPTAITRLDIQSCPGLLFSLHLAHCRHLTSLVIPSLSVNDVSVLPRTLLSVKTLNGFTAVDFSQINDNNAHEFPPRLNTLVISSKLHAPAIYHLPRSLTCYSFQGNFGIVQSAVSLGELLTEEPFLLAQSEESQILVSGTSTTYKPIHNEHFADVPLETYLSWLRSRRELRLSSGSFVKGRNLAFGYSFSQSESAKFSSATVPHSLLFQAYQGSGRLFCDNPLPTSLTSLTIASNLHSVRFSSKWLLPSSLLTLKVGSKIVLDEVTTDMSLREAWRREVPDRPTLLTPHDEQAQEGTEAEFYDSGDEEADYASSTFVPGDVDSALASPSAGTSSCPSNADIRPATTSISNPSYAIDLFLQLDSELLQAQWKEAMRETTLVLLELPPRLTSLSLGLSLGPVTIPSTVTELSFSVVHVDPICFLTIFALPATIRNLSIDIHSARNCRRPCCYSRAQLPPKTSQINRLNCQQSNLVA
jgi:hypothetical protein